MAKQTTKEFVDLVHLSGLVKEDRLAAVLEESRARHDGNLPETPRLCADEFIEAGIITNWHTDKLFNGKYKGFFLGKYKLLSHIGTGGMSSVYLAEHVMMRQLRAVKVLPKKRVDDSSYLARFYREAQAAATLDHQNIVRTFDIDEESGHHFIIMEYIKGRDLQEIVKEDGFLDYELAANYIAQSAAGLEHAHAASLVHRDVKPANLLVDERGVVKILDMGLARFTNDEEASLTVAHDENVLGTADYLSPEQAKNSHTADHRADLYSLGCTLYFVLTGHPPFPEGTLANRISSHQTDTPADIRMDRPDCPKELIDICSRMMRKLPRRRYQTASEVADALNDWIASLSAPAVEKPAEATSKRQSGSTLSGGKATLAQARPPVKRPGTGSSSGGRKPPPSLPSVHDTQSGESQETRKGMGSGSGSRRLRIAKTMEQERSRRDSGTIDLGIEMIDTGAGSTGSGKRPSLADERRARNTAGKKKPPLWVWLAGGGVALLAIIVLIALAAFSGGDDKDKTPPPHSPSPARPTFQDTSQLASPEPSFFV